jgi:hypothetical protein
VEMAFQNWVEMRMVGKRAQGMTDITEIEYNINTNKCTILF